MTVYPRAGLQQRGNVTAPDISSLRSSNVKFSDSNLVSAVLDTNAVYRFFFMRRTLFVLFPVFLSSSAVPYCWFVSEKGEDYRFLNL